MASPVISAKEEELDISNWVRMMEAEVYIEHPESNSRKWRKSCEQNKEEETPITPIKSDNNQGTTPEKQGTEKVEPCSQ